MIGQMFCLVHPCVHSTQPAGSSPVLPSVARRGAWWVFAYVGGAGVNLNKCLPKPIEIRARPCFHQERDFDAALCSSFIEEMPIPDKTTTIAAPIVSVAAAIVYKPAVVSLWLHLNSAAFWDKTVAACVSHVQLLHFNTFHKICCWSFLENFNMSVF